LIFRQQQTAATVRQQRSCEPAAELAERVAGGIGWGFTPSRVRRTRQPDATMQTCAMTVVPRQKAPLLTRAAGRLIAAVETPVEGPRIVAAAPAVMVALGLSMPEGT
jgi:hypothetical protein